MRKREKILTTDYSHAEGDFYSHAEAQSALSEAQSDHLQATHGVHRVSRRRKLPRLHAAAINIHSAQNSAYSATRRENRKLTLRENNTYISMRKREKILTTDYTHAERNFYSHAEAQSAQSVAQSNHLQATHGVHRVSRRRKLPRLHAAAINIHSAQNSAYSATRRENRKLTLRENNTYISMRKREKILTTDYSHAERNFYSHAERNFYSHAEAQRTQSVAQSVAQSEYLLRQHGVLGVFYASILCVLHEWHAKEEHFSVRLRASVREEKSYSAHNSAYSATLRENK